MRKVVVLIGLFLVGLFAAGMVSAEGGVKARCTTVITTVGTVTETVVSTVTQTVTVTGTTDTGTTTTAPTTTGTTTAPPPTASISPGQSWQSVYNATPAGSTIRVLAGVHPIQEISGSKSMTFKGDAGNEVRQLISHIPGAVYDGINVDCGGVKTYRACYEDGGAGTTFKNGSIGNVVDEKGVYGGAYATFDNVNFHDVVMSSAGEAAGVHNECLYAIDAESMILRNSTFTNCSVMDVFFTSCTWCPSPHYNHVAVSNNTFGASRFPNSVCCHYYSFVIGITGGPAPYQDDGWVIANNYFEPTSDVSYENHNFTNSLICGNTGRAPASWQTPC